MESRAGLKTIALFEALKGAVVLIAAAGLLSLIHEGAQRMTEELVRHFHLNPASHYPRIFLDAMAATDSTRLWFLAAGALLYSTIRGIESFGLWHGKPWAEWLGAASAAIYVPFEIYGLLHGMSPLKIALLALNLLVLLFLGWTIYRSRQIGPPGLSH